MIQARSIEKTYGQTKALKSIDLHVREGELFGLIGPDGAGKTSLIRILMTLLLADSGEASVGGYDVLKQYKDVRRITGYMPGKFALYADLTVEENLKFFATVFGTTLEENYELIKDIYIQIEPFKNRRAGKLSGGMKQKLALSCALVHQPKVLFLDEPTTGVDAVSRKEFWDLLYNFKKMGMTILVSTPYMDEASLCDRVGLMQNGTLLKMGTPAEIRKTFAGDLWKVSASNLKSAKNQVSLTNDVMSVFSFGQDIHVNTSKGKLDQTEVAKRMEEAGLQDVSVSPIEPEIEDVFIQLMKTDNNA